MLKELFQKIVLLVWFASIAPDLLRYIKDYKRLQYGSAKAKLTIQESDELISEYLIQVTGDL